MSPPICLDSARRPIDHGDCIQCRQSEYNIANPVPLTHLSQFRNSADCGYFSGLVLRKLYNDPNNLFEIRIGRHEAYVARESYLREINPPNFQPVCWHRHDHDLREIAASGYLQSLNVLGYTTFNVMSQTSDPSEYHYRLLEFLGYRRQHIATRYGIMFATSQGGGHWAAILKYRDYTPGVRTPQTSFLVYDPSTVRGTQDNLAWVEALEFARNYTRTILYIVAHYN